MIWPLYVVGTVAVTMRPTLFGHFILPLFRWSPFRSLFSDHQAAAQGKRAVLPAKLDVWSCFILGKAIHMYWSSPTNSVSRLRAAREIASLLHIHGDPVAMVDPDMVDESLVAALEQTARERSIPGVSQANFVARLLSIVGWIGMLLSAVPAATFVGTMCAPVVRPLVALLPLQARMFSLYYVALHFTAAGVVTPRTCSRPRAIFLSALGSGLAAVLMYFEKEGYSRRLSYARMEGRVSDIGDDLPSTEGESQDIGTPRSVSQSIWIERLLQKRNAWYLLSMSVAIGCPAVAYSSRTLAFFSSMASYICLTLLDPFPRATYNESLSRPRLAPCTLLWMFKFTIRKLTYCQLLDWCKPRRGLGVFDVGVSVFGPLAFNLELLRRWGGSLKCTIFLLVELLAGTALGNSEMVSTATLFAVPHATYEILNVIDSLPLAALLVSCASIRVSSLMVQETNRAKVLSFLRCIFFVQGSEITKQSR